MQAAIARDCDLPQPFYTTRLAHGVESAGWSDRAGQHA